MLALLRCVAVSKDRRAAGLSVATLQKILSVLEQEHALVAEVADRDLSADEVLLLLADLGRYHADTRKLFSALAVQFGLPTGARERILRYLLLRVGQVVDKDAIAGVSGISEWARRVRELRDEQGWPILSDENRSDLKPGQYVLEASTPRRRR